MFRKALLTTAAAIAMLALSSVARADAVVAGNSTGSLSTAIVNCSYNAGTHTFQFTITNTSPFDARITAIGFDIGAGNISGFSSNTMNAGWTFRDGNLGNVPQFNGVDLDFGFTTSNNGAFTNGFPNAGIAPNGSLTFSVSGDAFGNMSADAICNAIYVRFQRVGANGEGSDVGRPGSPVPEPMTMLLFGTGLAGLAARARKRRNGKA